MIRKLAFILLLLLLSPGLVAWVGIPAPSLVSPGCIGGLGVKGLHHTPQCPSHPSVAWMVPKMEGQLGNPNEGRKMRVQGSFASQAEISGLRYETNCWTTAGLDVNTLTEAMSTALAYAGLARFFDRSEGDTCTLQYEVKQQRLTRDFDSCKRNYSAAIVVSYSIWSRGEAPIWHEEITGEYVVAGQLEACGLKKAPRDFGSSSDETAAMEGAVANNLEVLIKKLRELTLDKGQAVPVEGGELRKLEWPFRAYSNTAY